MAVAQEETRSQRPDRERDSVWTSWLSTKKRVVSARHWSNRIGAILPGGEEEAPTGLLRQPGSGLQFLRRGRTRHASLHLAATAGCRRQPAQRGSYLILAAGHNQASTGQSVRYRVLKSRRWHTSSLSHTHTHTAMRSRLHDALIFFTSTSTGRYTSRQIPNPARNGWERARLSAKGPPIFLRGWYSQGCRHLFRASSRTG